jgi:outer membrane lipoprotein-sorting protein
MSDKRRLWMVLALLPFAGAWAYAFSEPPSPKRADNGADRKVRAFSLRLKAVGGPFGNLRIVYKSPHQWRAEWTMPPSLERTTIGVCDGQTAWSYVIGDLGPDLRPRAEPTDIKKWDVQKAIKKHGADRVYLALLSKATGGLAQLADPTHPRWKGEFPAIPDGKRVGEEEVDKTPVTVIEVKAPGISLVRWSFGKKDGILRQEVVDLGGRVPLCWRAEAIEINPEIKEGSFTFTPPKGAGVSDDTDKLIGDADPTSEHPVEGTVRRVEGEKVIVSLGAKSGVTKGQTLEVFRFEPKPIYLGQLRVTEVREETAVCEVLKGRKGTPIQAGDRVVDKILGR